MSTLACVLPFTTSTPSTSSDLAAARQTAGRRRRVGSMYATTTRRGGRVREDHPLRAVAASTPDCDSAIHSPCRT